MIWFRINIHLESMQRLGLDIRLWQVEKWPEEYCLHLQYKDLWSVYNKKFMLAFFIQIYMMRPPNKKTPLKQCVSNKRESL